MERGSTCDFYKEFLASGLAPVDLQEDSFHRCGADFGLSTTTAFIDGRRGLWCTLHELSVDGESSDFRDYYFMIEPSA